MERTTDLSECLTVVQEPQPLAKTFKGQSSLTNFFSVLRDDSPGGIAKRNHIEALFRAEEQRIKEEHQAEEEKELEQMAEEQEKVNSVRHRRNLEKQKRKEEEHIRRIQDLERRAEGVGREVKNGLFLGNEEASSNAVWIATYNITHILNATTTLRNVFVGDGVDIKYLRIPLNDSNDQDLSNHLPRAVEFINGAIESGGRVLVHCKEGKSRSVAIVLACLIAIDNMKLKDAYDLINANCWATSMNLGFFRQLQIYEVDHFSELCISSMAEMRTDREGRASTEAIVACEEHMSPKRKRKRKITRSNNANKRKKFFCKKKTNSTMLNAKQLQKENSSPELQLHPVGTINSSPNDADTNSEVLIVEDSTQKDSTSSQPHSTDTTKREIQPSANDFDSNFSPTYLIVEDSTQKDSSTLQSSTTDTTTSTTDTTNITRKTDAATKKTQPSTNKEKTPGKTKKKKQNKRTKAQSNTLLDMWGKK